MNFVDVLLVIFFLFFVGSTIGWCIEVVFRRLFTAKKWINPGFLTGPYLPLYGFGVAGLFGISRIPLNTGMAWLDAVLIILIMGVAMTLIEYIAGLIFIKGMKIKLWDYSKRWGNIQGIICPLFSLFWLLIGAAFYFVFDGPVLEAVRWFVHHFEFAFVVGMFWGIFFVDLGHSLHLATRIRKFADEHGIVVYYEKLKEEIGVRKTEIKEKASFLFPFRSLSELKESLTERVRKFSDERKEKKRKKKGAAENAEPMSVTEDGETAPASEIAATKDTIELTPPEENKR